VAVAGAETAREVELVVVVVVHLKAGVEVEVAAHSSDVFQGRTTSRQMPSTIQAPGIRHSLWTPPPRPVVPTGHDARYR